MNESEQEILEAIEGTVPWPVWGAWVGAVISFFKGGRIYHQRV